MPRTGVNEPGLIGRVEWEYQTTACNDLWVLPIGTYINHENLRTVSSLQILDSSSAPVWH